MTETGGAGCALPERLRETFILHFYEERSHLEITDEVGRIRGYGFDICVEDWTDSDYNDLYITMVAWKSKG